MKSIQSKVRPIIWEENKLLVLDQRLLPYEKKYLELQSYKEVIQAIKDMVLRGAPLIGITAAYGIALAAREFKTLEGIKLVNKLKVIGEEFKKSRPTAVNLKWAIDLILNEINLLEDPEEIILRATKRAVWIHEDDAKRCQKIGTNGAKIFQDKENLLTICNTGSLATGGIGTAFGVFLTLNQIKKIKVYISETRPRQQGARLTTFECIENGIDCILIPDTACGHLMQEGKFDLVITGADRIASNGDTANKIGTYQLAVLAKENNIPFYVAAPLSTFDLLIKSEKEIPIEEREENEVKMINDKSICLSNIKIRNPAFDITPAKYISGIITEKGILKEDYNKSIENIFNMSTIV